MDVARGKISVSLPNEFVVFIGLEESYFDVVPGDFFTENNHLCVPGDECVAMANFRDDKIGLRLWNSMLHFHSRVSLQFSFSLFLNNNITAINYIDTTNRIYTINNKTNIVLRRIVNDTFFSLLYCKLSRDKLFTLL